jgi:hypothetical protein
MLTADDVVIHFAERVIIIVSKRSGGWSSESCYPAFSYEPMDHKRRSVSATRQSVESKAPHFDSHNDGEGKYSELHENAWWGSGGPLVGWCNRRAENRWSERGYSSFRKCAESAAQKARTLAGVWGFRSLPFSAA